MAELWLGNVADDASDEEIRELLIKYGFPSFDDIQRVQGAGSRPGVLLTFNDTDPQVLRSLLPRIEKLFWKNHTLLVQVMIQHND
ncbi:RNA-binding protein [Paraburkholderia elongata]|uniref:RNA-binding protein n=1 Tax=Paraburkholderia elongata TaxID=2675747 RepID=A0A972NR26_9BURK|nr:RNA-binding protein [Paraburkholderia elongata]NPT56105.1 RNA-binding protein [Paraburkholderia elongata]